MTDKVQDNAVDELRQDVAELRELLKKMSSDFKHAARHEGDGHINRLRGQIDEGVEAAKEAWEDLRARGQKAAKDAEKTLTERPVTSVLAAMLAGVVLGRLFIWRRH